MQQKPRRAFAAAAAKESLDHFLQRHVRRRKYFSGQVWNLCALGAQIMRAATATFVKEYFFAITRRRSPGGYFRVYGLLHRGGPCPPGLPGGRACLSAAGSPETATTPQAWPAGLPSTTAPKRSGQYFKLGRREARLRRSLRQLCFFSADSLIFDAPDERREHNNDQCIVAVIAIDLEMMVDRPSRETA